MGRSVSLFFQDLDQARLSDARLPGNKHGLTLAGACEGPAFEQKVELMHAADEGRERGAANGLEPAVDLPLRNDAIDADRLLDTLEMRLAEILGHERSADEPKGGLGDEKLTGFRFLLQAGGKIGRMAGDSGRFASACADEVADDHPTRRDPDPRLERGLLGQSDRTDRGQGLQTRAHGAFRLVLMRRRPAEIGKDPVAEILGDVAAIAGDAAGDRILIATQDISSVLGIELLDQGGRPDEIAEQDRQQPALRLRGLRRRGVLTIPSLPSGRHGGLRLGGCRSAAEGGNGREHDLAMAEGYAELAQIGFRQMRQGAVVDVVLQERLGVFAEIQILQPAFDRAAHLTA